MDALRYLREQLEDAEVPEEELDQQWNVAENLDVHHRDPAHQPVGGYAADTQEGAEDGSQDDTQDGYLERIQYPDAESIKKAVGLLILDDRLRNREAGLLLQEVEAQGEATLVGSSQHLRDDEDNETDNEHRGDDLGEGTEHAHVAPERNGAKGEA